MKVQSPRVKPARRRPGTRRAEARELFRNAILEAAEAVFADRGFHPARIQDIARRARVGVGTVYNHFDQKEDIFRALIEERTEEMLSGLVARPEDPTQFGARLLARVSRLLEYVERHRGLFQILMSFGMTPTVGADSARELCGKSLKRIEHMRGAFRAIAEEGIASGDLDSLDPDDLAGFLGATIRSVTFRQLMTNEPLAPRALTIVRLFLGGAASRKS